MLTIISHLFSDGIIFFYYLKGAFWGSIASLVIVTILSTGAQLAIANKKLKYESLPLRTDGCESRGFFSWYNSTVFIG